MFTGLIPFNGMSEIQTLLAVINGKRPPRPEHTDRLGLTDELWGIMQLCWASDPNLRPELFVVKDALQAPSMDTLSQGQNQDAHRADLKL